MSAELNEAVDKLRIAYREANFTGPAYEDDEALNELAELLLKHDAFEQYIDALTTYGDTLLCVCLVRWSREGAVK